MMKNLHLRQTAFQSQPNFWTNHAGILFPPVTREASPCVLLAQQWQTQNYPGSECTSLVRILPALKYTKSGCQFMVGHAGLALTKSHMVVCSPRSYLTPKTSTLASHHQTTFQSPSNDLAVPFVCSTALTTLSLSKHPDPLMKSITFCFPTRPGPGIFNLDKT
jgi:hypothetical protein